MTLLDLFDSLDWSNAEANLKRWETENNPSDTPDPQFNTRFRQTLLRYALPIEIVGKMPEWTTEKQKSARWALKSAGVWDQVVDILIKKGLLEAPPEPLEDPNQLTMTF